MRPHLRFLFLPLSSLLFFSTLLFAQESELESSSYKAPSPFSSFLRKSKDQQDGLNKDRLNGIGQMGHRSEESIQGMQDAMKKATGDSLLKESGRAIEKCVQEVEINQEQPLSPFESYVRGQIQPVDEWDIHQFGYDLFQRPPSQFVSVPCDQPSTLLARKFSPSTSLPVGADYLLGPGDQLIISVWGKLNLDYKPTIDLEGKVVFPEIGVLHLAGLTFSEAQKSLEKELARYYRPSEVQVNISMGRLRSIRVFVIGNVTHPGSYTLSSFSTLINALLAAGGPSKVGTMRDIQIKRNGQTVVHFDLYDFLLKGDKTKDIRLLPEDVIWVPFIGPSVGLVGHVKNPAIYELKEDVRLLDLIAMAGGLTSIAFKGRVQIQRVEDHRLITYFEGDLVDIEKEGEKNRLLVDGDIVRLFPVMEKKNIVIISGAVGSSGEFGIEPGKSTVKQVLNQAGGLLYHAFHEGSITRVKVTQEGPQTEYIRVDLKKALEGDSAHDIPLEMNDYIFVRSIPEWQLYRRVELKGEVLFPGEYTIKRGESISSLIERAGGFTEKAYLKGAILTRVSVLELQKKQLKETIDRLEQKLLSGAAGTAEKTITAESALLAKGALEQRKELLTKLRAIEPIGRLPIELKPLDSFKGSFSDIAMEEGDVLVIPERPSSVQVFGSVYNQGSYLYSDEMTLSDYLQRSGGIGQDADKGEMYVLKVDGTAMSRRMTDSFLFSRNFMKLHLDPGDTIVVPEDLDKIAWLREIKDIVQILFQLAVTTSVVIRL